MCGAWTIWEFLEHKRSRRHETLAASMRKGSGSIFLSATEIRGRFEAADGARHLTHRPALCALSLAKLEGSRKGVSLVTCVQVRCGKFARGTVEGFDGYGGGTPLDRTHQAYVPK